MAEDFIILVKTLLAFFVIKLIIRKILSIKQKNIITPSSDLWPSDLIFKTEIIEKTDSYTVILASSEDNGSFKVTVPKINTSDSLKTFIKSAVIFESVGEKSDNFLKKLIKTYELEDTPSKMISKIELTCFVLKGDSYSNAEYKLFYDEKSIDKKLTEEELDHFYENDYFEIFLFLKDDELVLAEKDPEYRERIIKAFSK